MVVVVALLCPPGGSRAPVKGFGQATLRLREADNSWTDKGQLLLYACVVMHALSFRMLIVECRLSSTTCRHKQLSSMIEQRSNDGRETQRLT